MRWNWVGASAMALALAACGTNSQDRTQGGAAAGAATGAGVGALGGPVGALAGAAIGGGVGAITGAATSPQDVNLGRPPWSNPEVRTPMDDRHQARRSRAQASAARRTPVRDSDRAYMGGGMVGTDRDTGATMAPPPATGTGAPPPATATGASAPAPDVSPIR